MKIFNIYVIELVNIETGQIVELTTTIQSYKELAEYLTQYEKRKWKMLKVTRKED
jgi:hypothetical protein